MLKLPTFQKGFTLIELLVVIGILGILAAVLIATIDPFEQIKRATDTSTKDVSREYLSALQRYYTQRNAYPWDPATSGGAGCIANPPSGALAVLVTGMANCTTELTSSGELKSSVTSSKSLASIYISMDTANNLVQACYMPTSKSGQKDASTIYNNLGVAQANCKSQVANGVNCYTCLK